MKKEDSKLIIALAYANRYFPVLILISMVYAGFLVSGILSLVYGVYGLIGYVCRWKHIYCSFQNAYHEKMTPNAINWRRIRKTDAYAVPIAFVIIGVVLFVVYFL